MQINRIRMSHETTTRLSHLKGRTGLTPNILCRLGLGFSLSEPTIPNPALYPEDGNEFNRYTLMGEWDLLIVALVKERCMADGLSLENGELTEQFRAHLNRGVQLLYNRVKGLGDLEGLIPKTSSKRPKVNLKPCHSRESGNPF